VFQRPFLPGLWQILGKILIDSFGDDLKRIKEGKNLHSEGKIEKEGKWFISQNFLNLGVSEN
jgi:hypothetical protein